jgi:hypothetical protein
MNESRPALFRGRHFRGEIIVLCVRLYLRYPVRSRKSCGTTVVSKESAEPLPADNLRTGRLLQTLSWEQKHISFPLMRSFGVKMLHELCKCALQRAVVDKDQLRQAFLFR